MSEIKNIETGMGNIGHVEFASPTTPTSNSSQSKMQYTNNATPQRRPIVCGPQHLGKYIYLDSLDTLELSSPTSYAEHGPLVDDIQDKDIKPSHPDLTWSRVRHYLREPFAEFWGVFILVMFGDGVVAQVTLSGGENGNYQSISWVSASARGTFVAH